MSLLFQEQKHRALVQLRSSESTRKLVALVSMSQSYATHLRKDVGGKIEKQRGVSKTSYIPREEVLCHS